MGGVCGLSGAYLVKCTRGLLDRTLSSSLYAPVRLRSESTSSSFEGWLTFSTRAPSASRSISCFKK